MCKQSLAYTHHSRICRSRARFSSFSWTTEMRQVWERMRMREALAWGNELPGVEQVLRTQGKFVVPSEQITSISIPSPGSHTRTHIQHALTLPNIEVFTFCSPSFHSFMSSFCLARYSFCSSIFTECLPLEL